MYDILRQTLDSALKNWAGKIPAVSFSKNGYANVVYHIDFEALIKLLI